MTEKQKKLALIVGTIVIALVILLWSRKGSAGTTIVNKEEAPAINVSIPGFNIPQRGDIVINIPSLPTASQYSYNAISPCMCNGAAGASSGYNGPLFASVFNQGAQGPSVYNYNYNQQQSSNSNYNPFSYFAASPLG